ncbi:MAG: polyphosphate--nucleotide phosphotransferase [Bacteroidetes bacterium HGW-Bacteroidetes-9]|jgi:PPK2 family polyphosphate:nucleotide phosphotransferase|nr:MAG: polyphosphate--nucleotide phosphotransferase [Bacteroidetes bacterium HGW-Bacteroidetes-9]
MRNLLKVKDVLAVPGKKISVSDYNPSYKGILNGKGDGVKLLQENVEQLIELQAKLYADNRYSVLLIFQAMDAAGKDGTIKHVMSGLNPQGCEVYSFKAPSTNELEHDYMWRTNKCMPQRGRFGIFNRSYYEEVLVVKVHPEFLLAQNLPDIKSVDDVDKNFWENRYRQINDLEKHLVENGTIVLKFFLNVSKEEQKERFLERIDDPSKNWKFSSSDVKERGYWDDYMKAYGDMLTATSTKHAPWYVIPADRKWYMRYAVSNIIIHRLKELNLNYPKLPAAEKAKLKEAKEMLMGEK